MVGWLKSDQALETVNGQLERISQRILRHLRQHVLTVGDVDALWNVANDLMGGSISPNLSATFDQLYALSN